MDTASPALQKVRPRKRVWLKRLLQATAILVVTIAALGAVVWFRILPIWINRDYDNAKRLYNAGQYSSAIQSLEHAYKWNPVEPRVNALLGWSYWRLGDARHAEYYFDRAHRFDPVSREAKVGLAFAAMAMEHAQVALPLLEQLILRYPEDAELRVALGKAYIESGNNLKAVQTYQAWLERDPENQTAQKLLLAMGGYPELKPDLVWTPAPKPRPAELEVNFRTHGDYFQTRVGGNWKDIYLVGVNIGPARPGEFPSTSSRDFSVYREWLDQIAAMHSNTVRVYTILPPAFYQALRAYNETAKSPLWLVQEVWIRDTADDLYEPDTTNEFRGELLSTIDMLHGASDVGFRRGHNFGIYTADVSPWVLALAVGREVEPKVVLHTNAKHPAETSYSGRYISLEQGSPSEAWFARMCDLAASYEVEKYNAQRPLTVVNWPPLDPITHATEANYAQELEFRRRLGENIPRDMPPAINDSDAVSLDVAKFKTEAAFQSGLFALYHVYQHWPDFLLHEPGYAAATDAAGPNRYLGYLRELKSVYNGFPLLVGEYGLSTSTAPAHVQPQGWNNGGLTEKQQADLLHRFTQNIRDTRCAGGIVFEWQDEWFKHVHDTFTADFEKPWDRSPLWDNALDPEKHFGVVGYEAPEAVPLLRGDKSDWLGAQQISAGGEGAATPGTLQAVYATQDLAYLYLRLDVVPGAIDWTKTNYWIALNTLPGQTGSRHLPGIGVRIDSGANFLVQLQGPASSRLLIADNYNPNHPFPVPGRPGKPRVWRKPGMQVGLENSADFEHIVIEANLPRFARDGTEFPAINYDRSPLPYGSADRKSPEFNSHATWHVDAAQGMIELRIPWGLILVADPSSLQAFAGTDQHSDPISRTTSGISVTAFEIAGAAGGNAARMTVTSALPPVSEGLLVSSPPVFVWKPWNAVASKPYFKLSYYTLQKDFEQLAKPLPPTPAKRSQSGR